MGPLIKSSKFLSPFIREPLKTAFLLEIFERVIACYLQQLVQFFFSHTPMILNSQILVTLKYPLTILKPMIDIKCS